MSHNEKTSSTDDRPHGHRDRGVSNEQVGKKDQAKGAPTPAHDPEAEGYEAEKAFEPDRDGSRS